MDGDTATLDASAPATETGGLLAAAKDSVLSETAAAVEQRDNTGLTRPANIPENFWDAKTGQVKTEEVVKSWREITADRDRTKQLLKSGADPVPESPDKYLAPEAFKDGVLQLSKTAKNWGEIKQDDPMLTAFAKSCHEIGIGQKQFSALLPKVLETMGGILPAPVDVESEMKLLDGGTEGRGQAMVEQMTRWIGRKESGGDFSTEEAEFARGVGSTAFGVRWLAKVMNMTVTQPIPVGPTIQGHAPGKEDWQAMIADPKYWDRGPAGDAHRAQVRSLGERLFPGSQE